MGALDHAVSTRPSTTGAVALLSHFDSLPTSFGDADETTTLNAPRVEL